MSLTIVNNQAVSIGYHRLLPSYASLASSRTPIQHFGFQAGLSYDADLYLGTLRQYISNPDQDCIQLYNARQKELDANSRMLAIESDDPKQYQTDFEWGRGTAHTLPIAAILIGIAGFLVIERMRVRFWEWQDKQENGKNNIMDAIKLLTLRLR